MKKSKITILFWVLVFSFMYLVLVYPTDRSKVTKIPKTKRRKYWMNKTKVTTQSMNNLSSPWGQLNASITKK